MTALSKTYVYTNIHTNAQEKVLKDIDWRAAIFFFSEGSDGKYFRPRGLDGLHHSRHQLCCVGLKAATGDGGSINVAVSVQLYV